MNPQDSPTVQIYGLVIHNESEAEERKVILFDKEDESVGGLDKYGIKKSYAEILPEIKNGVRITGTRFISSFPELYTLNVIRKEKDEVIANMNDEVYPGTENRRITSQIDYTPQMDLTKDSTWEITLRPKECMTIYFLFESNNSKK